MHQNRKTTWLLLTYRVPAEPSKLRVGIWRRIRGMGAVYLQNGICVLPASSEHQRQFRVVQSDIENVGGEAVIFETAALDAKQEERVVGHFRKDREQDYEEFLERCEDYKKEIDKEIRAEHYAFAEVKENDEDLKKLKTWLERIRALDFFGAPAREDAERKLSECEALLEAYADAVFEREQYERPHLKAPIAPGQPAAKWTAKRRLRKS